MTTITSTTKDLKTLARQALMKQSNKTLLNFEGVAGGTLEVGGLVYCGVSCNLV